MSKNNDLMINLPKLVKGTGYNLIGSVSRNVLNFVYVVILTRFLTTSEIGIYYLGISIITFISVISLSGMDTGIRRFISISHGLNDAQAMWNILGTSLIVAISLSLSVGLFLFLFSGTIANTIFSKSELNNVLKILSAFLVFFSLTEIFLATTQAFKFMQYRVISVDIVNNLLKILFAFVLFCGGLRLLGAVWGCLLSISVTACLSYHYLKKIFPFQEVKDFRLEFKKLLSFSVPYAFAKISDTSSGMIDTIILGYFGVAESVGIYNIALKVAMLGGVVLGSFNMMFAPMISDLHNQGKLVELEQLYANVTKWIFSISLPLFLFIIFFSKKILIFFGQDFVAGNMCLIVICIGQIINALTGPSGIMILMTGHPYINLSINAFNLTLSVVLNIFLIPTYGIVGCAIAVSTSLILTNIIRVILVNYILGMNPYNYTYLKPLIAGFPCILFVQTISNKHLIDNNLWSLTALAAMFMISYLLSLILLKLDASDRFMARKIIERLSIIG